MSSPPSPDVIAQLVGCPRHWVERGPMVRGDIALWRVRPTGAAQGVDVEILRHEVTERGMGAAVELACARARGELVHRGRLHAVSCATALEAELLGEALVWLRSVADTTAQHTGNAGRTPADNHLRLMSVLGRVTEAAVAGKSGQLREDLYKVAGLALAWAGELPSG